MKFRQLKSIGHNIADSLASGVGLLIGEYDLDVYGEAQQSPDGFLLVDFLEGTVSGDHISESLAHAVSAYAEALPGLCTRHGTNVSVFQELTARYSLNMQGQRRFVVTVEDKNGRRSVDEFIGSPGKRAKELDRLGRVRPKRHR